MQRALALAALGAGATRPNPPVGAVIVKSGRVIGEGWHHAAGRPHAEVAALQTAGTQARNATLYVTLEPCCTVGRTGACTDRIIEAGIRRVVAAVQDPNPAHAGRGLEILRRQRLSVETGCEEKCAAELLAPFAKWISCGLPRLTLKLAMSLDGKIADRTGRSRWITSEPARQCVQELRRTSDAIMVGAETARRDRPRLLPADGTRHPWRVVVDTSGNIDNRAPVFCDRHRDQTILATTAACPLQQCRSLEKVGVRVWIMPVHKGRVSLRSLMRRLGRLEIMQVLCEGGGELAASLTAARLVDEFYFFIAPRLLGGRQAPGAMAGQGFTLGHAPELEITGFEKTGPDLLVRARPLKI